MDLSTTYLGFELANPIVVGACPLGTNVDTVRHLEEAGAAAIVLPSLFEEEIRAAVETLMEIESAGAGFAEASTFLPDPEGYHVVPDRYLVRQKDTGGRCRRGRAQRLLPADRPGGERRGGRTAGYRRRAGGQNRGDDSGCGEALALLLLDP
jgi:hypothetical protein